MKIKTEKQFTLPQLIEWGFENDVTRTMFSDDIVEDIIKGKRIRFEEGVLVSIDGDVNKEDTFTIEIDEEITEDTKLFLVERYIDNEGNSEYHKYKESSIKNAIENNPSYYETTHFYIENDDRELILIWRDGKLVE